MIPTSAVPMSDTPSDWPVPESFIAWGEPRDRDPHGCCRSCQFCALTRRVEDLAVMLAWDGRADSRARSWPGPRNMDIIVRRYVFLGRRDGFACFYCREPLPVWQHTTDHMLPRSRGGGHGPSNEVLCCQPCNSRKGSRTPEEWLLGAAR